MFSRSGHWLTPACLHFLQYWLSIWNGLLHERHINWKDWQGIKVAQVIQVLIFFLHGNNCSMLCSLLLEPEQAAWFLLATGLQWRPFPKQGPRCLPNSRIFSSRCEGDTLHCSDPLRTRKLWREWFDYSGHWLTPACLPSLRYWWLIWTELLHERPINWQDRHDIELAQVIQVLIFFQHGTNCSMLCSLLLEPKQATWFLVAVDFLEAATSSISNEGSSQNKVWGVCQTQAFSAFDIAKETPFIDLTFWQGWKVWR